jgi:hypothetical protein
VFEATRPPTAQQPWTHALVTKDEHDSVQPVKPFPDVLYLRAMLDCLLVAGRDLAAEDAGYAVQAGCPVGWLTSVSRSGILFLEKSRQIMATWLVCAYLLWRARRTPHQLLLVQSRKEEDAANLVYAKEPQVARMSFMELHLPTHLRSVTFPTGGAYGHLYFDNGSHVWGIPEGGHVIRSNTPSVVFADEAAFQPEFGESYTAALPCVKGGGTYLAVSSANPGEFEALVEADAA